MRVFKFGGASVKDADGVKNLVEILKKYELKNLVVVISAMGKTTNMLEKLTSDYFKGEKTSLEEVKSFHYSIMNELFEKNHTIYDEVNNLFVEIEWAIEDPPTSTFSFEYDQIVSVGELLSTKIVSAYLNLKGINALWLDARDLIRTDNTYRNAKVDWQQTKHYVRRLISQPKLYVTQGFIGCTSENFTTTLGREGSDYTASILAYCLSAKEVVVWKDVKGFLNADPNYFTETTLLKEIPYSEAIELAYFGAKVVHPKTIQPLKSKNITLNVKSFLDPQSIGSKIGNFDKVNPHVPSFILKENQILISIKTNDLSFIVEEHISHIFSVFAEYGVKVNLMQNSALSFSVCVDNDIAKTRLLIDELEKYYILIHNNNLTLYTIRHYDSLSLSKIIKNNTVLLEQKSRNNIQLLVRSN